MIEVNPTQLSDHLRAFFKVDDMPGSLRFQALLAGSIAGKVWINHSTDPTWGILQESAYGTLHFEGDIPAAVVSDFIKERQHHGEVLYGFWEGDNPVEGKLPSAPYDGWVWESSVRQASVDLNQFIAKMPMDCVLRWLDASLFERVQDYQFYSDMFSSAARALNEIHGLCLMRGDEILCEAFAGTAYNRMIELGVNTWEGHRRKGYATLTCAAVIHAVEQQGYRTYWNCAAQNSSSLALAHRLGYAPLRQYRLLGWF